MKIRRRIVLSTSFALFLVLTFFPNSPLYAASTCAGFIPATITTPANLITAVQQAESTNCPGADTIDLAGNTITFTTSGFTDGAENLAMPAITTPITITNGTITRSSATGFKFLLVDTSGDLTLNNITISNGGGTGIGVGGAVHVADGNLTVTNATFLNNSAPGYGGGAILSGSTGTLAISDSLFQGNQGGSDGGAINLQMSGPATINRVRFLGNSANNGGGLVLVAPNTTTVRDSLFAGNSAVSVGSAVAMANTLNITMINTTVVGNNGSSIFFGAGASIILRNGLIWGNGSSFYSAPATITITYTAAEGYAGATINTGYTVEDFFVNPLTNPTSANTGLNYNPALYDWTLRPFSPALDAAENTYASTADVVNATRRVNDPNVTDTGAGTAPIIDMGALERQTSSCSSFTFPYTLTGSTNGIRRANLRDAIRCANLNGASLDVIDLNGQTVTYASSFATYDASDTALPQVTTPITIQNGIIERDTAGGTPNFRLLDNAASGTLVLNNLTLQNGNPGTGAGNLGGAVYNSGTLTIQQTILSNNTAYNGGALYNNATGTITRSTFSGNSTVSTGSAVNNWGSLTMSNSTFTGNTVTGGAAATILNGGTGTLTLINSTVSDNTAAVTGGLDNLGTLFLYNSILANNTPLDCYRAGGAITFSAGTSNIIETDSGSNPCGTAGTNYLAVDPQLGALTGSPAYYPLASASSPAVNAGDNASIGGAAVDEPGNTRTQQTTVDLGAYESPFASQTITVQFGAAGSGGTEASGGTNIVLRVTTSDGNPTSKVVTVTVAVTGGTATAADYNLTGTITIPAGTANNALVSSASGITITDDTVVEPNETLSLLLSSPTNAVLGGQITLTHNIVNDDTAAVTIADVALNEGFAGTINMTFTATLDNPVPGGFTVNYATANGTATTADADYVAASGTLTFAGTAGETQTFTVLAFGDPKVEPNETFTVSLNSVSNISVTITDTATGTINNDDTTAVTIADVALAEGNAGTTNMTFTATLGSAVAGGFTVNYATANGTATTADTDYVAATGTLTFAGTAGETQTFTVTINGDTKVEPNETFTVSLNTVSNAAVTITDTATGTITNDDTTALTIADVALAEGNAGTTTMTFTATLGSAVAGGFTVNYATTDGTATTADTDYVAATGTLTFAGTAGETQTFTVTINGDTKVEPNETFTVSLNTVSNAAVTITDTAIGTITNDDGAVITIADVAQAEGNTGTTTMTFTATLGSAVAGGFTVNYATSDGTATIADADYVAVTGTLTFAGTAGETQTFTVTINGDTTIEPNETFTVSLNSVSNTAVTITDTATGTLTNDDIGGYIVDTTATAASIPELGGTTTFTIRLASLPTGTVVLDFGSTDTTECAVTPTTFTFDTTNWNIAQTITITGVDDVLADGTQPCAATIVQNASSTAPEYTAVANPPNVTLNVTDDETPGITINGPVIKLINELGGTTATTFTVVLTSQPSADVTIPLASTDTTECIVNPTALTFTNLNWNTAQTVTITAVDDLITDGDQPCTAQIDLTSSADANYNGLDPADVTVTVVDNDVPGLTFSTVAVTESGVSQTYTVQLNTQPSADVQITAVTPDAQCSISGITLPLTFTSATWNIPQTITVTAVDDTVVEGNHTCVVAHTVTTTDPAYTTLGNVNNTINVLDNDVAVVPTTNPSSPQPTGQPQIGVFDPALSKIGILLPGQLGVLGERISWQITVVNNGTATGTNVVITDTLRPELGIEDVQTSKGTSSISGQTVTVNIGDLAVGETVHITIITKVLQSMVEVDNSACLYSSTISAKCVTSESLRITLVKQLPSTGETPWWVNWIWVSLVLVIGAGLLIGARRIHRTK